MLQEIAPSLSLADKVLRVARVLDPPGHFVLREEKVVGSDDVTGDGRRDTVFVDLDGDGVADMVGKDTTGDGEIDSYDTTGDGKMDTKVRIHKAV